MTSTGDLYHPPGIKVIVHEKTYNCWTWSLHFTDDWYIGPSMEHYICVQCFIPKTSSVRNVNTLTLFPDATPFTKMERKQYLQQSVGDTLAILSKPKTQLPFLPYGDTTTSAVEPIANLLQHAIPRAPPVIPTPKPTPTP